MITHIEDAADQHVEVALVSEQQAIVPGQKFLLEIRFDLQDGWHTYWVNPGDAGEPPRITWELPAGFQAGSIQWPYPLACRLLLSRILAMNIKCCSL